jgi:hypothetical protein
VQNEPSLGPEPPQTGIVDWKMPAAGGRRRPNAQNEPNFAPPQAADGGNCTKRSQTWVDWGMWAKAVVVWGVARPGSEMCKTNPISPERSGTGAGDPSRAAPAESDGAKRTQFGAGDPHKRELWIGRCRLRAGAGGQVRKTNPISPRRGRRTEGERACQRGQGQVCYRARFVTKIIVNACYGIE